MATNKIELKSEEVRELLKTPPSWLVRWGSLILLVVLFLLVLCSVLITFPKVDTIPLNLVRSQEIIPILMPGEGKIKFWFKSEGDSLLAGEPIALLANKAEYIDVLALEERLARFEPDDPSSFKDFGDLKSLQLGELESNLEDFENALSGKVKVFHSKKSKGFRSKQIKALEHLLGQLEPEYSNLSESYRQQKEAFKIAQNDYASGRLSEVRLREIGQNLDALEKKVLKLESEIKERKDSLAVIRKEAAQKPKNEVIFDIKLINDAFDSLKNSIDQWKAGHLIFSSGAGRLVNLSGKEEKFFKGEKIADIQSFRFQSLVAEGVLDEEQINHLKEGRVYFISNGKKALLLKSDDWELKNDEYSKLGKIRINPENIKNISMDELDDFNPELKIEWGSESLLKRLWNDYSN
ncbi:MAG: hypothetical protein R2879_07025 [Saprospiraceae bacterium]